MFGEVFLFFRARSRFISHSLVFLFYPQRAVPRDITHLSSPLYRHSMSDNDSDVADRRQEFELEPTSTSNNYTTDVASSESDDHDTHTSSTEEEMESGISDALQRPITGSAEKRKANLEAEETDVEPAKAKFNIKDVAKKVCYSLVLMTLFF